MAYDNRQKFIWDQTARENEAREVGREEGRSKGIEEGLDRINRLISLLVRDNRIEELMRSATEPEFQKQLLREYHID
jgi:predicted transposase YdaD